jgi:subtilisin family serine protease
MKLGKTYKYVLKALSAVTVTLVFCCFFIASYANAGTEYIIEIPIKNSLDVIVTRAIGLKEAQAWKKKYQVKPELYERLKTAGFDCILIGGVTELSPKSGETNPLAEETFLDSGDVYMSIPQGTLEVGYYSMTASGAPDWATVTAVEFSTLIEGYGEELFACWFYQLAIFHGTPGEDYYFWMNFGDLYDGTDDNMDSDIERDCDIDIDNWSTNSFNGENPNGNWGISCLDIMGDYPSWMRYLRIRIHWESGPPPNPEIRVEPASLHFEILPPALLAMDSAADSQLTVPSLQTEDIEKAAIQKKLKFDLKSDFVPGKIIVRFKSNVDPVAVKAANGFTTTNNASVNVLLKKHEARAAKKIFKNPKNKPQLDVYSISVNPKTDMSKVLKEFNSHPDVIYAEPDFRRKISAVPTDSEYPEQWAYQNIQAEDAWDIETGNPAVVIAVIDTGVDWDHPDLAANIWQNSDEIAGNGIDDDGNGYIDDVRGWDTFESDNDPMDTHGHGSHVAGIAAAVTNNVTWSFNVAGTAWNCRIMPVRAGEETFEDVALFEAIDYAVNNGARVINMSMGGPDSSMAFETACNEAYNSGVLLVAAAGNEYGLITSYPAAFESVIGVAATDDLDQIAEFSNYGTWVDLSAPGVGILSTVWDNDYDWWDGTSMSCPFVAGAAGLVFSHDQLLTNEQVRSIIVDNTDDIDAINPDYAGLIGSGRLNIYKALNAIGSAGYPRKTFTIYNDGTGTLKVTSIRKKYGKAWISNISPSNTNVPEAGSRSITVTVNPTGLPGGFTDSETIIIDSNDADEPSVEIPVTIYVGLPELKITKIEPKQGMDAIIITFNSVLDNIYNIYYSNDPYSATMSWSVAAAGIMGQDGSTKWTDTGLTTGGPPSTTPRRYYKVQNAGAQ